MFRKSRKPATTLPSSPKSALREWLNSLAFAVVAATLIRFFTFEAYAIPTPSLEGSLLVGDHLFVSKLHYGPRTPKTPLQVPLTHQTVWGTNIPSYTDVIQLPQFRLPGFSDVKTGDVVVFNYPPVLPGQPDHPVDMRTHYVKRCIGTPGDRVALRRGDVFVNDRRVPRPEHARLSYFLKTTEPLNDAFFRRYGIVNDFRSEEGPFINWQPLETTDSAGATTLVGYRVLTTAATADKLRRLDWVQGVEPMLLPQGEGQPGIWGNPAWNVDNFGPLTVPKAGMTVPINPQTIAQYGPVIARYEGNDNVRFSPTGVSIGGKAIRTYTFRQDYYFMLGDNRHNSEDSRFWGFVPADHVVGKAVFVWLSVDPVPAHAGQKIRWNRLFRVVE